MTPSIAIIFSGIGRSYTIFLHFYLLKFSENNTIEGTIGVSEIVYYICNENIIIQIKLFSAPKQAKIQLNSNIEHLLNVSKGKLFIAVKFFDTSKTVFYFCPVRINYQVLVSGRLRILTENIKQLLYYFRKIIIEISCSFFSVIFPRYNFSSVVSYSSCFL